MFNVPALNAQTLSQNDEGIDGEAVADHERLLEKWTAESVAILDRYVEESGEAADFRDAENWCKAIASVAKWCPTLCQLQQEDRVMLLRFASLGALYALTKYAAALIEDKPDGRVANDCVGRDDIDLTAIEAMAIPGRIYRQELVE